MTRADVSAGLDWRPYDPRGTTSRVREIVTRGKVEFELCCEGGAYVIRRTVRRGDRATVSEAARGLYRRTMGAWKLVIEGDAG